jgi:hypothetical protein
MTFDDLAVRNMVRAGVPEKRKGARVRAAIQDRTSRDRGGAAAHRFARFPQE